MDYNIKRRIASMDKIGKFLIFLIVSIFISFCTYNMTVEKFFPNLKYTNKIEFQLAYLNHEDSLKIIYKVNSSSKLYKLDRKTISKTGYLNRYFLYFPYTYAPFLYFGFGETYPVDFAISNLTINGEYVNKSDLIRELQLIGYDVVETETVIYARHTNSVTNKKLNLYNVSNNFINISDEQLSQDLTQDKKLRSLYWFSLFVVIAFFFYQLSTKIKNPKTMLYILIAQYFILFIASYVFIYDDVALFNFDDLQNFGKNYSAFLLFPLFLFLFVCSLKLYFRLFVFIFIMLVLFCISADHFVQNVFGTRFLYAYWDEFDINVHDAQVFLLKYIYSFSGFCYALLILSIFLLFFIKFPQIGNIKKKRIWIVYFWVISLVVMTLPCESKKTKFLNVFQINANGLFTDGDYKRPYLNYKPYNIEQLGYTAKRGLNLKKNVIIVIVESLGCNVTFLCGNDKNYSTYIEELARNNVWFPNYYSNAYHTNSALFSIITGHAFVEGSNSGNTPFRNELYSYSFLKAFKENGYKTYYYNPASVLMEGKMIEFGGFDNISNAGDYYYKNKPKNGVFSSVWDEEMYNKIVDDLLHSTDEHKLVMLSTLSTHTPYVTPLGTHSMEQAFSYSDKALKSFIEKLVDNNYFDNGIVIITGDHIAWASNNNKNLAASSSKMAKHKVPLIMINGNDHGKVVDKAYFSHTSLGILLQYLMLPAYYQNKLQINPLVQEQDSEYIVHYDLENMNEVDIKSGEREDKILLDGDQTRFLYDSFTNAEQNLLLGYLSWIRK